MKLMVLIGLCWGMIQCSTLEIDLINLKDALNQLLNQLVPQTQDVIQFGPGQVFTARGASTKERSLEAKKWLEKFIIENLPFLKTDPENFKTYEALDQAFIRAGKVLHQTSTEHLFKVLDILWPTLSEEVAHQLIDSLNSRGYDVIQMIADLEFRFLELKATDDLKATWSTTRLTDQELKRLKQIIQVRESRKKSL